MRVALDVVVRDAVDRPEAVRDERHDAAERAASRAGAGTRRPRPQRRGGARPRARSVGEFGVVDRHQSLWIAPIDGAFWWKYCSNTFSAVGAAAVPPWPPFSISAQTTSVGLSYGP